MEPSTILYNYLDEAKAEAQRTYNVSPSPLP